jgi:NDP-sugar pyrophosphorylase family protein
MAGNSRVVIVPAAGHGQRYKDVGVFVPKPLIRFNWRNQGERTMIEHAVGPLSSVERVVVVCRGHDLEAFCAAVPRHWKLVPVQDTRGQSDSVRIGLDYAMQTWNQRDQQVIVINTDAGFAYPLDVFYQQAKGFNGAVMVFRGHGDTSYSYINDFPLFSTAEEKRPISSWAMAGAYYFRDSQRLFEALIKQAHDNITHAGELYLSGVYNTGPYRLTQFLAVAMHRWQLNVWGTPEDLARDGTVGIVDEGMRQMLSFCK